MFGSGPAGIVQVPGGAEGRTGSQIRADGGEDWRDLLGQYLRESEVASIHRRAGGVGAGSWGPRNWRHFGRNMAKATGWKAAAFAHAPAAVRAGVQRRSVAASPLAASRGRRNSPLVFAAASVREWLPHGAAGLPHHCVSAGLLPVTFLPIALIVLLVGTGFLLEALRTVTKGSHDEPLSTDRLACSTSWRTPSFGPVAVALLALLTITLIDLGGLFFTFWRKRRESRSDLPCHCTGAGARRNRGRRTRRCGALAIAEAVLGEGGGAAEETDRAPTSTCGWKKCCSRGRSTWLAGWIATRLFVRIGPMLGLAEPSSSGTPLYGRCWRAIWPAW